MQSANLMIMRWFYVDCDSFLSHLMTENIKQAPPSLSILGWSLSANCVGRLLCVPPPTAHVCLRDCLDLFLRYAQLFLASRTFRGKNTQYFDENGCIFKYPALTTQCFQLYPYFCVSFLCSFYCVKVITLELSSQALFFKLYFSDDQLQPLLLLLWQFRHYFSLVIIRIHINSEENEWSGAVYPFAFYYKAKLRTALFL